MQSLTSKHLFVATTVVEWSADSTSGGREAINDPDPGFEDDENKHSMSPTNGNKLYFRCFLKIHFHFISNFKSYVLVIACNH